MGDRKDMIDMDRKNTLLLTVIAIATLLVAVVGATFAFFTSQNTGKADTKVNVTTETVNVSAFNSGDPIYLRANMANFSETYKNVRILGQGPGGEPQGDASDYVNAQTYAVSNPSAKYDIGSGTEGEQYFCYKVKLIVDANNFVYSKANPGTSYSDTAAKNNGRVPELVLTVKKGDEEIKQFENDALKYLDNIATITTYKSLQDAVSQSSGDSAALNGFDITLAAQKEKANQEEVEDPKDKAYEYDGANNEFYIVNPHSAEQGEGSASDNKIFVLHGQSGKSDEDKWTIEVTIVNYDFDQKENASTVDPEKTVEFKGKIEFEPVDTCPEDVKVQA